MSEYRLLRDAEPGAPTPAGKDAVLAYLDGGEVVMAARQLLPDRVDPSRGSVVPVSVETDGVWVWDGSAHYYLEHHDVWPEPDFVRHVQDQGGITPSVSEAVVADVERWVGEQS